MQWFVKHFGSKGELNGLLTHKVVVGFFVIFLYKSSLHSHFYFILVYKTLDLYMYMYVCMQY